MKPSVKLTYMYIQVYTTLISVKLLIKSMLPNVEIYNKVLAPFVKYIIVHITQSLYRYNVNLGIMFNNY